MAGSASDMPLLRIDRVSKSFGAVHALRETSLELLPREIHALVGENGAGKSTLVGVLTGLLRADSGEVLLDGQPYAPRNPLEARALGVAAVYQDPRLFPHLSVAENIVSGQYPTRSRILDRRAMHRTAKELLARLGVDLDVTRPVAGLTVAEAQYVEIARAVATPLRVLVLDEPTSALTPGEASRLYDLARSLREQGTTVVWISHRMEEVALLADRVSVFRDGTDVLHRRVVDISAEELVTTMVGRSVLLEYVPRTTDLGDVRLSVQHASSPGLFQDVDLQVRAGEIVCLAGLVGSGRTELAEALIGDGQLSGTVEVDGRAVRPKNPRQMGNFGLVHLPEDRDTAGVIAAMSIGDNLSLPSLPRTSSGGFLRRGRERALAAAERDRLSIKGELEAAVSTLSGGNRQKVAVGRLLALDPEVLVLDEPTHGIDVGTKGQIHDLIRTLAREHGKAVLIISSDLVEVLALADRIVVMRRGRAVAELDGGTATQEDVMQAATGQKPLEVDDLDRVEGGTR